MKLLNKNNFVPGVLFVIITALASLTAHGAESAENPRVRMTTNLGGFIIELYPDKAPKTVENFIQYVNDGHYTNTVFHRVIEGFMIQGGGFDLEFQEKETRDPVQNEADNLLPNVKFSIAMARTPDPHSATAQFFLNSADNEFLNHRAKNNSGWGYTVFGQVIDGQALVEWISKTPTGSAGPFPKDVPVYPVVIESAEVLPSN